MGLILLRSLARKMMNRILLMMIIVQTQVFAQFTIPDIKVEYVIDGDTFIAFVNDKKERIRMKCIDAPELKQTFIGFDNAKKEIGAEAREHLESLLIRSDLLNLKCSDERDKHGRLTCDVFDGREANGQGKSDSINLQMVKDGYAYAMPSQSFSQADGVIYLGHQHLAILSQVGLWRYGVWDESWRWRNH